MSEMRIFDTQSNDYKLNKTNFTSPPSEGLGEAKIINT